VNHQEVGGSFRDPSGHLFFHEGILYRQVNHRYRRDYDALMNSGLYEALTGKQMLIPHEEADTQLAENNGAYRVIRPRMVPFISYPYEWSFSQYKDAALLTLGIHKQAVDAGMVLKDASAYNVQFLDGRPIFIDTLSFETYEEGEPWVAYRQFCQHFLAPLLLMARIDIRLSQLLRVHIDGIPLDLAKQLLKGRNRFCLATLVHIRLHARVQKRYEGAAVDMKAKRRLSRRAMLGIIDNLESAVRGLRWKPVGTEWADYYTFTNYEEPSFKLKQERVSAFIDQADPQKIVWDLGANTGLFSRLASDRGLRTIAFDIDPAATERDYLETKHREETHLLPLVMDLTNPSGGIGWASAERMSLADRGPADLVMALALIHHLAISNNVPLDKVARYFASLGRSLIIEFVPKQDSQVQKLLASREDVFPTYDQTHFEQAFASCFTIERAQPIEGTQRTLYLMRAN